MAKAMSAKTNRRNRLDLASLIKTLHINTSKAQGNIYRVELLIILQSQFPNTPYLAEESDIQPSTLPTSRNPYPLTKR